MRKKQVCAVLFFLILIVLSVVLCWKRFLVIQSREKNSTEQSTTEAWNPEQMREGLSTVIEYDKQYNRTVSSAEEAKELIRSYGETQRALYDNPKVKEIELQMEQDYGIFAVNLGEMDIETALDVEQAFSYMYETYPVLQGSLTNLTLGNFSKEKGSYVAKTHCREFVMNGDFFTRPTVVKYEIMLGAAKFRNRENLLKICENGVREGHWPEGMNISALVVHELGHHLQNVIAMKCFGLDNAYYITEENETAFSAYLTDNLKDNQSLAKEMDAAAYEIWRVQYGHTGTQEEFRGSISGYAKGIQADGGISYSETFAEAITDVYLHGDSACDASKAFLQMAGDFCRNRRGTTAEQVEKGMEKQ